MIGRTISVIADNIWFYLFIAILVTVAFAIQEYGLIERGVSTGVAFATMVVMLYAQRATLFGGKFSDSQADGRPYKPPLFRFFLKAAVLVLVPIIAFIVVVVIVAPELLHSVESMSGGLLLIYTALAQLIIGLSFAIAGTWLPATIQGERPGFVDALMRAPSTFLSVFLWMLLAVFIEIVKFFLTVFLVKHGMSVDIFTDKIFSLDGFLLTFALQLWELVVITFVAVVLARTYMRFEDLSPDT